MTTTTAAAPVPAATDRGAERRHRFVLDGPTGCLLAALSALDSIGLTDALSVARGHLARAAELIAADRLSHGRAEDARQALAERLADGALDLGDAGAEMAAVVPWLPGPHGAPAPAAVVADDAVRVLRTRAVRAAREGALDVHKALSRLADDAIGRAVASGRRVLDVREVARRLKAHVSGPDERYGEPAIRLITQFEIDRLTPSAELERADPGAVGAATAACRDLDRVLVVVEALHVFTGGHSTLYDEAADRNLVSVVVIQPESIRLAVADAAGLKPKLRPAFRPAPVRPPGADRDVVGGVSVPAGWVPPAGATAFPGFGAR